MEVNVLRTFRVGEYEREDGSISIIKVEIFGKEFRFITDDNDESDTYYFTFKYPPKIFPEQYVKYASWKYKRKRSRFIKSLDYKNIVLDWERE